MMYTRSSTTLLILSATLLVLIPHTLAATPTVEDVLGNPPPFYPQHADSRLRSKYDERDGVAVLDKCDECWDKMRKCTAVSGMNVEGIRIMFIRDRRGEWRMKNRG
jgi:hypothetical protein